MQFDDLNLEPNSNKHKAERKPLEKVVTGEVRVKKKSIFKRTADAFLTEDRGDISTYLLFDVIVPAIKDLVVDTTENFVEAMFYGKGSGRTKRSRSSGSTFVSYDSISRKDRDRRAPKPSVLYEMPDYIFKSRQEADRALEILKESTEQYGEATLGDFYELIGVTGNGYPDRLYGWTDLRTAYVSRSNGGYCINFPRLVELGK